MSQKRENFVRLAEARVNRALREIRLIGNLSNKSAYQFDDADIRKMFGTLQKALDTTKGRFTDAESSSSSAFKL
jgi:tRNA A37 methylthiotransferase MiaB